MSSLTLFRSELLTIGQTCQSKGRGRINIISVESVLSFSHHLLSRIAHLGQERNTAVMGRLDLLAVVILFMYSDIQLTSAWYVVYFWRTMFSYVSMEKNEWFNFFPQDCEQLPHDWT